jgi:hypothetical protein
MRVLAEFSHSQGHYRIKIVDIFGIVSACAMAPSAFMAERPTSRSAVT